MKTARSEPNERKTEAETAKILPHPLRRIGALRLIENKIVTSKQVNNQEALIYDTI